MPFEENQFFMNQFTGEEAFPGIAQQFEQGQTVQQFEQGQVNNFVNHTTRMGNRQAVENVNYYDTYHHRINNYHTMNTNRYRDHYVDHNVYYNNTRNIYDGADYHTVSGNVVDRGRTASNGGYSTASNQGYSIASNGGYSTASNEGYSIASNGGYSTVSNEGYSTIQGQGNFRKYPGCGCRYRRDDDDRRRDDRDRRYDDDRRKDDDYRMREDRNKRRNCQNYIY